MSTDTISNRAADLAHEKIADAEQNLQEIEERARKAVAAASKNADQFAADAKKVATQSASELRTYVEENPFQTLGIAFAAGIFATLLLKK